ncbi:hypothetical protein AAFF_G00199480 [Aldrovandia affinis]|uniref:Adhesion G protein-coupled receptor E2-like n=1 Tax=Aldrovandia affinis TaxID=143900 RepID=A0AAD7RIX3_9TELE|nr:hypothetical protein AAFF_G00199480 [Aldrovandia affinis]
MSRVHISLLSGFLLLLLVCYNCLGVDPCVNHSVLSHPWRNIGFSTRPLILIDDKVYDKSLEGQWVRFTGIGGDVIPEFCIAPDYCGSALCAFLDFSHPNLEDGIEEGKAQYGIDWKSTDDCNTKDINGMKVLACAGGYYVYLMPEMPSRVIFGLRHSRCNSTTCGPFTRCSSNGGCSCIPGYKMYSLLLTDDSYNCGDINECASVSDEMICGPNADCINTLGTYSCTCHQGYRLVNNYRDSSDPCPDIDECEKDPPICGPNANCTNTPGAHNCTCHLGYRVQSSLSVARSSNPCEDVDECRLITCGTRALCYNTAGSYYCSCQTGYIPSTGLLWSPGVTSCESLLEEDDALSRTDGQFPGRRFLDRVLEDLENFEVLPEGIVTSIVRTTQAFIDMETENGTEVASVLLNVYEKLITAMVEPTKVYSSKSIKASFMDINIVAMGPRENVTSSLELEVSGAKMAINLPAIGQNNHGSAAIVLASVRGMEKLMSPRAENLTQYSDVIIATLANTNHTKLSEPINFTILHEKRVQAGSVICVYWEDEGKEKRWSVDGCTASFSTETQTVCSCTHLSSFALLLQVEDMEDHVDDAMLELINVFCMAVGLTFLTLAILSFLFCSWNPKINNTARLHLSICLFLGHLLSLVGVSLTGNTVVCAVIAGLLHFLLLSACVWMLLEAVQILLLVRSLTKVQVIRREGLRALYLLLIGYGAPTVVVGVSAAVYSDGYGSKRACWLVTDRNFRWSFIGPVCSVLTLNSVLFCVIAWSLQPTLASMKSDVSQAKDTRLIVFKIVAQFFILAGHIHLHCLLSSQQTGARGVQEVADKSENHFLIRCFTGRSGNEQGSSAS